MIRPSVINPSGFVNKATLMGSGLQNSLKKLHIFKTASAIGVPEVQVAEKPRSILKSGATPSICAIGASFKSNTIHTVEIFRKRFIPASLTVEKGDSVEFVVNPHDDCGSNYVICVDDIDESGLLSSGRNFKITFNECGSYPIKCSINYEMKGKIDVVVPRSKFKEWEEPVIPSVNASIPTPKLAGIVERVFERSSTSLETIKDRALTEKLTQVLNDEENLETKSFSRKNLEDTFNNYTPVMLGFANEELCKEVPKTEEEKKEEEEQEHKFLEQQRTSSRSSRAKSRSNKNTPESNKYKDSHCFNPTANCFKKLDLSDCDDQRSKASLKSLSPSRTNEENKESETEYSQSIETLSSYRPINIQSPFCMLFHTNFENPIISKYQTNITNFENQNEEQKNEESKAGVHYQGSLKYTVRRVLPKKMPLPVLKEEEVRLAEDAQAFKNSKAEAKKKKVKEKRQKYKKNMKMKMNKIKTMEISQPEIDFIKMIKFSNFDELDSSSLYCGIDGTKRKEISDQKYANKLNILSNLCHDYSDEDVLDL